MLSGKYDKVTFRSNPSGAKVSINGKELGTTNSDISVKRIAGKTNPIVKYELDGYNPVEFYLDRTTDPVYWLNATNLFLLGYVDVINGRVYKSRYKEYEKQLTPKVK